MTPEQHLAAMIGDSVIRIAQLAGERDALAADLAARTAERDALQVERDTLLAELRQERIAL